LVANGVTALATIQEDKHEWAEGTEEDTRDWAEGDEYSKHEGKHDGDEDDEDEDVVGVKRKS
jgi:hypothetical protein